MKIRSLIVPIFMTIGLALLSYSEWTDAAPRLLYNPTPSAPIGWYRLYPGRSFEVGTRVAARLPPEAQFIATNADYLPEGIPVIKTIWAGPGEAYCVSHGYLQIEGRPALIILTHDSKRRALPVLTGGCRRLEEQEYLLISDETEHSFDSRYFGPVDKDLIIGPVDYLGKSAVLWSRISLEEGGARGKGADGKIKGSRAARGLTPCLHIIFYRAVFWGRELCSGDKLIITKGCRGSASRGFTPLHSMAWL